MKMALSVACAVLLVVLLKHVDAAAFMSLDPCPEGVSPGETWIPEYFPGGGNTPAGCMSCSCMATGQGYQCVSCGVMAASPECYLVKESPDQPYPECCNARHICPGDPDFDPSHLDPHHQAVGRRAERWISY